MYLYSEFRIREHTHLYILLTFCTLLMHFFFERFRWRLLFNGRRFLWVDELHITKSPLLKKLVTCVITNLLHLWSLRKQAGFKNVPLKTYVATSRNPKQPVNFPVRWSTQTHQLAPIIYEYETRYLRNNPLDVSTRSLDVCRSKRDCVTLVPIYDLWRKYSTDIAENRSGYYKLTSRI